MARNVADIYPRFMRGNMKTGGYFESDFSHN